VDAAVGFSDVKDETADFKTRGGLELTAPIDDITWLTQTTHNITWTTTGSTMGNIDIYYDGAASNTWDLGTKIFSGVAASAQSQLWTVPSVATNTGHYQFYFWTSVNTHIDIAEIQLEHKDHATNFTVGTRSEIVDLSGNESHGVLNGTTSDNDGSIVFNGTSDYIDLNAKSIIAPNTGSISAWVKASAWNPTRMTIFTSDIGANWVSLRLALFTNYYDIITFTISNGTSYIGDGMNTGPLDVDTWYNIVGTYDGSIVKLYLNSVIKDSYASSITPGSFTPSHTGIGSNYYADRFWNGNIAIVNIYDKTLTQDEITQNFNALRGRFGI
jgi:hypothetical protein